MIDEKIKLFQSYGEGYFEEVGDHYVLYHVTNKVNIDGIIKSGLVCQEGFRSEKLNEGSGIYLFTSFEGIEDCLSNWLYEEIEEEHEIRFGNGDFEINVITLYVPKGLVLEFGEFDEFVGYEIKMTCDISSECIHRIEGDPFEE